MGNCRLDREFALRRLREGIVRIVGQPGLIAHRWPIEKPNKLPGLRGVEVPECKPKSPEECEIRPLVTCIQCVNVASYLASA